MLRRGGRGLLQGDVTTTHCRHLGRGLRDLCAQEPETCLSLSPSFQDVVWGLNSLFTVSISTKIPNVP